MQKLYTAVFPRWLALLLLLLARPAAAQVSEYTFSQSTRPYVPLTGGTVVATAVYQAIAGVGTLDDAAFALPAGTIPFPFDINGTAYTSLVVNCNGHLIFNDQYGNDRLPLTATTLFSAAIAPLGADLQGEAQDRNNLAELRYQALGAAPNRTFVVQWKNFHFYNEPGSHLNFQVRLHEGSHAVDYHYQCRPANRIEAVQVGLRGPNTADFINRTGTWPASTPGATNAATLQIDNLTAPPLGLVYTFTPGAPRACPTPYALRGTLLRGTRATLTWFVNQPAPGSYTVQVGPAGFDPSQPSAGANTYQTLPATGRSVLASGLAPLTNYDFYVTQDCGAAGPSVRSVKGTFVTTLLNDDPEGAFVLPITTTCQPVNGSSAGALASDYFALGFAQRSATCGGDTRAVDVWYQFTTPATGLSSTAVQLTITDRAASQARVFAGPANGPLQELRCTPLSSGTNYIAPPIIVTGLTPSTTYYVQVATFPGYQAVPGPFTICLNEPPACSVPTTVRTVATSSTTAQLTFVPGSGSVSNYTVTLTPDGGSPVTTTPTASPVTFTGLVPGTRYRVTLQANCSSTESPVVTQTFFTPQLNDEPAGAVPLPLNPTCTPISGTLESTTHSASVPLSGVCGASASGGPADVWYSFVTPATPGPHSVRLTVAGLAASRLTVYAATATGTPGTRLACSAATTLGGATSAAPPLDVSGLAPLTTYFVRVDGQTVAGANSYAGFTICLTPVPTCLEPTALRIGSITTTTAVLSLTPSAGQTSLSVTYSTVGQAPQTVAVPVASLPYTLTGLLPGRPYTVSVTGNCGGSLSPPVTLTFNTTLTNDEPAGAIALPLAPVCAELTGVISAATLSLTTGTPLFACTIAGGLSKDVWYRFTTAASGAGSQAVRLVLTSTDAGLVQVYSSANGAAGPFTSVACTAGNNALPLVLDATNLQPATTYYVQVAAVNASVASPSPPPMTTFTLCLSEPPTCPEPRDLTIRVSNVEAELSFTPAPGVSSYNVAYGTLTGGLTVLSPNPTTVPITLSNLFPNTTYQVLISPDCGPAGGGLTLVRTFTTTNNPVPSNSQCATALPVGCGQTVLGSSTLGASGIGAPPNGPTCGTATVAFGVGGLGGPMYYRFEGTGDSVVVSTCHPRTTTETNLYVYTGSCGAFTCVASRNGYVPGAPFCSPSSGTQLGFRSVAGTTYYILLSPSRSGRLDNFGMTISCVALPCLPPRQLTVVPRADSTATVSFGLPAAAVATGSFTATATPVGGTGALSTVTGSVSPLTLAGLTPGTAYTVTVTSNCPAGTATSASVAFSTPLASRAVLSAQVQLFPNPAHATATLLVPAGLSRRGSTLLLYNSLGQLVRQQALPAAASTTHAELRLTGLPTGVYTLRLATSQGTILKRLMVE